MTNNHPIRNNNKFSEGIADGVRNPAHMYQYNGLEDKRLSLVAQSGTDAMHTIGNVTSVMLQFILDLFPEGVFKTALPSTKIAHRQLRHTPKQIRTQEYPLCIVNPRISLHGLDNRMASGSFATTLWNTTSNRFQNRSEMPQLLFDKQKGIEWRGKHNRVVMYFDFVLSFHSIAEQINWASYLINKIPVDGYFDIDTALELAIPDGLLYETSKYCGVPVKDNDESIKHFVDYLNTYSHYPISYRFSSGRHTDAFYMNYMTPILCNINDFKYDTINKRGNINTDCLITFTVRAEFNTIGMFDLATLHPDAKFIQLDYKPSEMAIPLFSDIFNPNDFPLAFGWKILTTPFVQMDWGETEIPIGSAFTKEHKNLIKFHLDRGLDPGLFLKVKLRENKHVIEDGYYVDWENMTLVITNANYSKTYRLLIVINQLYLNERLNDMYNKK
jgi:hypothetical protein